MLITNDVSLKYHSKIKLYNENKLQTGKVEEYILNLKYLNLNRFDIRNSQFYYRPYKFISTDRLIINLPVIIIKILRPKGHLYSFKIGVMKSRSNRPGYLHINIIRDYITSMMKLLVNMMLKSIRRKYLIEFSENNDNMLTVREIR